MDDRELLEMAAKAAGLHGRISWNNSRNQPLLMGCEKPKSVYQTWGNTAPVVWNPLTDGGDRYRLIKALRINIDFSDQCAWKRLPNGDLIQEFWHEDGDDADHSLGDEPHAVLRVAAEIGKAMA